MPAGTRYKLFWFESVNYSFFSKYEPCRSGSVSYFAAKYRLFLQKLSDQGRVSHWPDVSQRNSGSQGCRNTDKLSKSLLCETSVGVRNQCKNHNACAVASRWNHPVGTIEHGPFKQAGTIDTRFERDLSTVCCCTLPGYPDDDIQP
jgi:hypothetical protein